MLSEKTIEFINRYFDDETSKEEEVYLFNLLSSNEEGREYFKSMTLLREITKQSEVEIPHDLEERILNSIVPKQRKVEKISIFSYFTSAVAVALTIILIALSMFFYSKLDNYKNQLESTMYQVKQQNRTIQLLYNSLQPTEVRTKLSNKIMIKPTI